MWSKLSRRASECEVHLQDQDDWREWFDRCGKSWKVKVLGTVFYNVVFTGGSSYDLSAESVATNIFHQDYLTGATKSNDTQRKFETQPATRRLKLLECLFTFVSKPCVCVCMKMIGVHVFVYVGVCIEHGRWEASESIFSSPQPWDSIFFYVNHN